MKLAPGEHHLARHARLRTALRATGVDALIVTSLPNIAYLTGLFASTAMLLVGRDEMRLFVDARYLPPATDRLAAVDGLSLTLISSGGSFEDSLAGALQAYSGGRVGIEAGHMTVRQHFCLTSRLAEMGSPKVLEAMRAEGMGG